MDLHIDFDGVYSSNGPGSAPSGSGDSHQNEGFLKSTWHRLTNQHKPTESPKDPKDSDPPKKDGSGSNRDEPKKASGSG